MSTATSDPRGTRIREIWPTVARVPAVANLGKLLTKTIILAPLAWLVMSLVYFGKLLPFIGVRYRLTDKGIMIVRCWSGSVSQQVPLSEIDDVVLDKTSVDQFFRSANLEIIRDGRVAMTLVAVPDAESYRHAILDARNAWA